MEGPSLGNSPPPMVLDVGKRPVGSAPAFHMALERLKHLPIPSKKRRSTVNTRVSWLGLQL